MNFPYIYCYFEHYLPKKSFKIKPQHIVPMKKILTSDGVWSRVILINMVIFCTNFVQTF
tara:strand:- start:3288 stop:3464 length:177 start_codon:yes stop_codon:yes gene_type:complete